MSTPIRIEGDPREWEDVAGVTHIGVPRYTKECVRVNVEFDAKAQPETYRILRELPAKPKDLKEWWDAYCTKRGFMPFAITADNLGLAVRDCVRAFGGRMFKRVRAGEWYVWDTAGDYISRSIFDSSNPQVATFPAFVPEADVRECVRLIAPYLKEITE